MNFVLKCDQCGEETSYFDIINGKVLCLKHITDYEEHEKDGTQFEYWNRIFPQEIKK